MNLSFLPKKNIEPLLFQMNYSEPLIIDKLSSYLTLLIKKKYMLASDIVILCIGTDRSTGDSLGPFVGSNIIQYCSSLYYVYGTIKTPVHAQNLEDYLDMIQRKFDNPFIIAVDACLGQIENIGHIQIGDGSLQPGAAVQKKLPDVGDIFVKGIVNMGGYMDYFVLQNTRLSLVMDMAQIISKSLHTAVCAIHKT